MFAFVDTTKLDPSYVNIQTSLPVYITLSTIPSRMKNTIKIIKHFLSHVTGFHKIILNIPYRYERWPEYKVDTSSIDINDPRFMLNMTKDYGPLTKMIGSMNLIPDESITIVCDDMCYKLDSFKDIAELQDRNLHKAFSFFVYPYSESSEKSKVMVPQGADLISSYTQNLSHFPSWWSEFRKYMGLENYRDSPCFFVDDQVLGWYFQIHGIKMEQVDRKHRIIYIKNCDNANKLDNLNHQVGQNSRENTMKGCYIDLDRYNPLG